MRLIDWMRRRWRCLRTGHDPSTAVLQASNAYMLQITCQWCGKSQLRGPFKGKWRR